VRFTLLLHGIRLLCYPLLQPLRLVDAVIRRLAGVPAEEDGDAVEEMEREILDAVSEGERQGAVSEEEREMIESVIELRTTRVDGIMTTRTDIVAIPMAAGFEEARTLIREQGHSRIPVYEQTIDRILGILYAKDLLHVKSAEVFDIRKVMRKPLFVPTTKWVRDLLHDFRQQKVHIAIVLDEYGGTAGLVTIEDILEQLVGDISDEYEPHEPHPMVKLDERTYEVDARMSVGELNEELSIELPESDHYETIGGFVSSALGRIPIVGEQCQHDSVDILVIDAEPRRVNRLRIRLPESMIEEPAGDRA